MTSGPLVYLLSTEDYESLVDVAHLLRFMNDAVNVAQSDTVILSQDGLDIFLKGLEKTLREVISNCDDRHREEA